MTQFQWNETLAFSEGMVRETCMATIKALVPGCVRVDVVPGNDPLQRRGVDYKAVLRGGAEIMIDHKARAAGASQYWTQGPELALEIWSVRKSDACPEGVAGWALDRKKKTDLVLFTFDARDTEAVYLIPFQLLRVGFRRRFRLWEKRGYRIALQATASGDRGWESECMFVPARTVLAEINALMMGHVAA